MPPFERLAIVGYPRLDLVEALVGGHAIAPQIAAPIFPSL
jgi:hypothetical protein